MPTLPRTAGRPAPWTADRETRAVRLYIRERLTAAEVAEALGEGVSRAAVIGKLRRLGFLKRDAKSCESPAGVARPAARAPSPGVERRLPPMRAPKPLPPLREAAATGSPLILACLPANACRWPIDDPGPGRMHLARFCAGPAAGGPYCAVHAALAVRGAA